MDVQLGQSVTLFLKGMLGCTGCYNGKNEGLRMQCQAVKKLLGGAQEGPLKIPFF